MTVYAKCPEDLDTAHTPYLTPGKRYAVTNDNGYEFKIVDDDSTALDPIAEKLPRCAATRAGLTLPLPAAAASEPLAGESA